MMTQRINFHLNLNGYDCLYIEHYIGNNPYLDSLLFSPYFNIFVAEVQTDSEKVFHVAKLPWDSYNLV